MAFAYRIACARAEWDEMDLSGAGAKATGGRWNRKGVPMVYASSSIALAALETIVHLGADAFPLDRYVIEIKIPDDEFAARLVLKPPPPDAWDSIPESYKSKDFGSAWLASATHLVLDVPSVIVPWERNLLLNPAHPGSKALKASNLGKFLYDLRLLAG